MESLGLKLLMPNLELTPDLIAVTTFFKKSELNQSAIFWSVPVS